MAIYIAICDDHMADRKQAERLFGRESDRRINTTGVLYIDSYGSMDALLQTPMRYDVFFIDMSETPEQDSLTVAGALHKAGVKAPIVLCSANEAVLAGYQCMTSFKTLQKPLDKNRLSSMIDFVIEEKKHRAPLIELRGEQETFYVTEDELLYAKEDIGFVNVTMTGGRTAHVRGDIYDIQVLINNPDHFLQISRDSVVNMDYVLETRGRAFLMTNDELMTFSFFDQHKMLTAYQHYKQTKDLI